MPKQAKEVVKKVDKHAEMISGMWDDLINDPNGHYVGELMDQEGKRIPTLELDLQELENKEKDDVIDTLINFPMDVIDSLKTILEEKSFDDVFLVIKNASSDVSAITKNIREFRSEDIGKLVVFNGLVRTSTGVIPRLKLAALECSNCETLTYINQDGEEPDFSNSVCDNCKASDKEDMSLRDDKSIFINFIKCDIEENPEGLKGRQPERIHCEISGTLTDERYRIGVGDRVSVIGIYRARKKNKTSLVYEGYVQILGVLRKGKNVEGLKISKEEEEKFMLMSKDKKLLVKMAKTVAPNISGHDVEKSAIVLQLMGGNQSSKERRGDIHILLIGDPGVGKSALTKYIMAIAPHVVKASGAPTTSAGLGACVRKDEDTPGGFVLEAGAAVLADGGILIIDEFDKMDKEVRGSLHEIMEDQVITINKANINTQLITKCSVLAIMNPKRNRFNKEEVVSEQIDLLPSMLSRFDLVFALRDTIDADKDRSVCEAILRARQGSEVATEYSKDEITKYIIFAKSKIGNISYSEEAIKILTDKFVRIRSANTDETIPITNRQMEGLSRISEACAKLRLSDVVEAEDANIALGILDYYLNTMCMDPATGKYNSDMINGTENEGQKKVRIGLEAFIKENYTELTSNHVKGYIVAEELEEKFKTRTGATEKEYGKAIAVLLGPDKKLLSVNGGQFYNPIDSMKPKGVLKGDDGKAI